MLYCARILYIDDSEEDKYENSVVILHILQDICCLGHLCPLLLTWFNFNPSMDK